jgi:hypothetical protein
MQVVDNKMVGDTGFEPVTSTMCKKHKLPKASQSKGSI